MIRRKIRCLAQRYFSVATQESPKIDWIKPNGYDTSIVVHNSATNDKVPLILNNNNCASWYMCGPTVYDSPHIGHACTYVRFDIIRRLLTDHFNINVFLTMGITDIDDKIIKRSASQNEDWQQLARLYEREFFEEMSLFNVRPPVMSCRVSDHVPEIINFVQRIKDGGFAYVTSDGSVYFESTKFARYGKLHSSSAEDVTEDDHSEKKASSDFALWKGAKKGEPFWESPWGKGRPGWHIECSAIASKIFGNTIDIHSGGIDLLFPHHENEEAQSCCFHGTEQWVNYWLHTGHLYLTGDVKMSKSLQNTIGIREMLDKYTANEFRMMCLLTRYRNDMEYSDKTMELAKVALKKIEHFLAHCDNYIIGNTPAGDLIESSLLECLEKTKLTVNNSFQNDFNTMKAMRSILELVAVGNKMYGSAKCNSNSRSPGCVHIVASYIRSVLTLVGISPVVSVQDNKCKDVLDVFLNFRHSVRKRAMELSKDKTLLTLCDEARQDLLNAGITVKDYKDGSTYLLKNS